MVNYNRQNISSNSLFHFVKNIEYLIDILENGFKPFYKDEHLPNIDEILLISMKCFCDIPLGLISNHIQNYGNYGIGISKTFAIENGITPVIYTHNKSTLYKNYLEYYSQHKFISKNGKYEYLAELKPILPYFKLYEEMTENGLNKYYNEREWRYIPNNSECYIAYWIGDKEKNDDMEKLMKEEKSKFNKSDFSETKLNFNVDDVEYLILKENKEISLFISKIRYMKKDIFKENEIDLLISKIITTEQIENDF